MRKYSVRNAYEMLHRYASKKEAVVVNLDGDDWFIRTDALTIIADAYISGSVWVTYGQCEIVTNKNNRKNYLLANTRYPTKTIADNLYRKEQYRPLHPRTWKTWLYKKISKTDFLHPDGTWLQFCEDQAMMFPMMEMAGVHVKILRKKLSTYNAAYRLSDITLHLEDLIYDQFVILKKPRYEKIT